MDGMGHGGFARGQTKDLRKGLKTRPFQVLCKR